MKKIIIEGKFIGAVNNFVIVDVFRPNALPKPYDFRKTFTTSFKETITDLESDLTYNIDFSGFTTGEFELKITGAFDSPNVIKDSFTADSFNPGYIIHTNN